MSYKTVEVELEDGRVHPSGAETLPPKAHALLTILHETQPTGREADGVSLGDLVREVCGIGRGEYTDLSTNNAHMDDFGR
jgi:hypothetical protein